MSSCCTCTCSSQNYWWQMMLNKNLGKYSSCTISKGKNFVIRTEAEKSLVNRKSCFSWTCMKSSQINVRSFYQQSLPVVRHFKPLKFDQTFHWCSVDVASSIKSQCKTAALRLQRNLLSLSFAQLAINQVLPYFLFTGMVQLDIILILCWHAVPVFMGKYPHMQYIASEH